MALWVRNNYEKDFVLMWDGKSYELFSEDWQLLPEEVIQAYFPKEEDLARFLPTTTDRLRQLIVLRGLLEIFLSRWGSQINDYYRLTGNIEADIENFFKFLENFEISNVRPLEPEMAKAKKERKKIKEKTEEGIEEEIVKRL